MSLTIIVAVSENNLIGIGGKIPWKIKEDMERFKQLTLNHTVIMGRKTYESLPQKFRPLPGRKNIVLSNTLKQENGIYIARNIEEALELTDNQDTYVVGGEKIYKLFLPLVDRIELTRIHQYLKGDAFFPKQNRENWKILLGKKNLSEDGIPYSFSIYLRR